MNEHFRALFSAMMLVAGLLGYALGQVLPANIAAPLAVWIALLYGKTADEVSNKFRTDVERILEPNGATLLHFGRIAVAALILISLLGPIIGAPLAACAGLAILGLLVKKWF